jgi:uncharacterized protein YifN (PemK superfamily)
MFSGVVEEKKAVRWDQDEPYSKPHLIYVVSKRRLNGAQSKRVSSHKTIKK